MRRLKVPLVLTVVTLAGCPGSSPSPSPPSPPRQCPSDYYCTSDAARAENCYDAGGQPLVYASDLGTCYPPV